MNRLLELLLHSRRRRTLFFCGAVLGVCLGFFLFQLFPSARVNESRLDESALSGGTTEYQPQNPVLVVPKNTCLEFFGDSTLSMGRQSHFHQIDNLDEKSLIELIRLCGKSESSTRVHEAQELLIGKLSTTLPDKALQEVWSFPRSRWKSLLEIVFDEWMVLDANGALRAADDLDEPLRSTLLRTIFSDPTVLSNQDLEEVAIGMGFGTFWDYQIRAADALQYLQDPQKAWDSVIGDSISDEEQEALLVQIAGFWIHEGDFEVIDHLLEDLLNVNYRMFDRILASIVSLDEYGAFVHGLNMSSESQRRFIPRLISLWSQRDPTGAFEATSKITQNSIRKQAQVQVVQAWAKKNPQELLGKIQSLPKQLRQESVMYAISSIARSSPQKAGEAIDRLRPILGSINASTEYLLVREWSKTDPVESLKWVNENASGATERRSRMMQRILIHYALVDPVEAIKVALSEEPHSFHGMVGLESEVISSLADSGKLATAILLLEQVRESARKSSFISVGESLIESNRASEALELSHLLSEDEQLDYFRHLTDTWLSTNTKQLLENLSTLPSKSIQAKVAEEILVLHKNSLASLTNDQLTYLRSFLSNLQQSEGAD